MKQRRKATPEINAGKQSKAKGNGPQIRVVRETARARERAASWQRAEHERRHGKQRAVFAIAAPTTSSAPRGCIGPTFRRRAPRGPAGARTHRRRSRSRQVVGRRGDPAGLPRGGAYARAERIGDGAHGLGPMFACRRRLAAIAADDGACIAISSLGVPVFSRRAA